MICSEEILPGLDCAAGYYNGSIPVNWVLVDERSYYSDPVYGTQHIKGYFAQLPADLYEMTVEFALDLSILDAKLVKGEATVVEAVYSDIPYNLPLEPGENYFSLYYSDGADTYYFFDFYIQVGPFITAMWTSGEEDFVQTSGNEYLVVVGQDNVEVHFGPNYNHISLYMNAYPMDPEVVAWIDEDGTLDINGLKYGMNIIRLEVEDPAGGVHEYFLHIWYGLNIGMEITYKDSNNMIQVVEGTTITYNNPYNGYWYNVVATIFEYEHEINDLRISFTDLGLGYQYTYYVNGIQAQFDAGTLKHYVEDLNLLSQYDIEVEDSKGNSLMLRLYLLVIPPESI